MDIPGVDLPGAGDIVGGIGGFFGGLAADAGQLVVDYAVEFIFGLIAQAIAMVTSALAQSFNSASTSVDLVGGWFTSEGGATVTTMTSVIAGSLVLVFLLLSLIRSMAAGEFSAMWRAAFVDVPAAFLGTALTVLGASALLTMVDEASVALLGRDAEQLAAFAEVLADTERLSLAGLLGIVFGLLFIIGAVLVWVQLLVRAALIYIVIAFAPITWVTRAYPGTRNIASRGIQIAVALIFSKFAMAVAFRLGSEALGSYDPTSGEADLGAMLVGASMMLLTAFMPWLVFKALPLVDAATSHAAPQGAALGAAAVGGGLAVAGLRRLSGSATSTAASVGGSASGHEASGPTDSGGGGGGGDGSGSPPNGGASAAATASAGPGEQSASGDNGDQSRAGEPAPTGAQRRGSRSPAAQRESHTDGSSPDPIVVTAVGAAPNIGTVELDKGTASRGVSPGSEPRAAEQSGLFSRLKKRGEE